MKLLDGLRGGVTTPLGPTWAEQTRHLGVKCRTETLSSCGAGGAGDRGDWLAGCHLLPTLVTALPEGGVA